MRLTLFALVALAATACKPSDILSVPPPTGIAPASSYATRNGAEQLMENGYARLAAAFGQDGFGDGGLVEWSGMLTDEFQWGYFSFGGAYANIDARRSAAFGGYSELADGAVENLMAARFTLLASVPLLEQYEPPSGRSKIGLAFALVGYTELLAGEDYCAGLPLGYESATGIVYGTPLTTDSLFGVAETHFDSAVKYAGSDPIATPLAALGLARTLLDRGQFAQAATGLSVVPTSFAYLAGLETGGFNQGSVTESDMWDVYVQGYDCGLFTPVDRKGQNGLNYISAADPRLVFNPTIIKTCDGYYGSLGYTKALADSILYYPMKVGNPSSGITLATGVEARLIEAEAALQAGQVGTWAAALNALRSDAPATYLQSAAAVPPLTPDSTTGASAAMRVDVMFRERAFWLYGNGTRLGDMRRLIRQYGRDQSTVFPIGSYPGNAYNTLPTPIPTYGPDVNLTLPTGAGGLSDPNANYKGCLNRAA